MGREIRLPRDPDKAKNWLACRCCTAVRQEHRRKLAPIV